MTDSKGIFSSRSIKINNGRHHYWLFPVITAFLVRLVYQWINIPDFWGDSYHSLYISQLTLSNDWVYSDYKGREVVWLPLYRYLVAFQMWIFQGQSLLIPHLFNALLGVLSCGLVAFLVRTETDKRTGAIAGFLLAFSPWHIAYGHMNMPEMLGSLILLLGVFFIRQRNALVLMGLGFAGVLTKNEVTLYLMFVGLGLLWWREWKMAAGLAIGALVGLAIWGNWNYQQTGHFFWWITERSLGSSWDKLFYSTAGRSEGAWYVPLMSILQVSPLVLLLLFRVRRWVGLMRDCPEKLLILVSSMVLFNWVFITVMNLRYFPYPDARYFMITLPVLIVALVMWLWKLQAKFLLKISVILSFIIFCFQTPTFYFLHFPLNPMIEMGKHIKEAGLQEASFWNDFPTASYYGELPPDRSFSSRMLAPKETRYEPDFDQVLIQQLAQNKIEYIIQQEVPYSYVTDVWPQMREATTFQWEGFTLTPVYHYVYDRDETAAQKLRKYIEKGRTSVLWRIERVE